MKDYDLVIISKGLEGRYAAQLAINLKYRVALVELPFKANFRENESIFNQVLSQFAKSKSDFENQGEIGFKFVENTSLKDLQTTENLALIPNYEQMLSYGQELISSLDHQYSLAMLSALGVDLIQETGEFCRLPHLGFITETRQLYGKKYLITTGTKFTLPSLTDLQNFTYLTLTDLFQQKKLTHLGNRITIFTEDLAGIELAYSLAHFEKKVILITPHSTLLSQEDLSISKYIEALLEAQGITIINHSYISQVKKIEQQIWIQAGDEAIATDDIIYIGKSQPDVEGLNLEGVKVKYDHQGIKVNQKLQTTNPYIYACGSIVGGYYNFPISQYEAKTALKNMQSSWLSSHQVNYNLLPYQILSYPCCARIGLTEKQARIYDPDLIIIEEFNSYKFNLNLTDQPLDYIKIILSKNKQILGVHLIGNHAHQVINLFTLSQGIGNRE